MAGPAPTGGALDPAAMRASAEAPVQATAADVEEVARTLCDAFAADPMMDWMLRPDARRDAVRLGLFQMLVREEGFPLGRIDRPSGGGAAAIWMPFELLGPTPFLTELRGMPAMLRATGLARFSRLAAIRRDMDDHHPKDRRHAYLWFLGVAPAAQGRGVGSALLRAANARLDAQRLPAYLETATTRNVALYRRHGYEVISRAQGEAADAPTMWSMWREAQRA